MTLREVLEALPPPGQRGEGSVRDPNYGLGIPLADLADHFHEVLLSEEEAARIKRAKTAHPYMGRMAFPDDLDRPARTVVATQLGRETLVLGCRVDGRERFRRATVRECATLQGFPITYQFGGSSLNARYRLAGDAVPPKLTYAVARAILAKEGMRPPEAPIIDTPRELSPPVALKPRAKGRASFPEDRVFRRMIPGKEVRGCRVDFDNQGGASRVEWAARLYVGEGKGVMRQRAFTLEEAVWEFGGFCLSGGPGKGRASRFLDDAASELVGGVPAAGTLQEVWTGRREGQDGPEEIAVRLAALVDKHFPADELADVRVPPSGRFDVVPSRGLRVRLAAALAVTAFACELANREARGQAPKGLLLAILATRSPTVLALPGPLTRRAE